MAHRRSLKLDVHDRLLPIRLAQGWPGASDRRGAKRCAASTAVKNFQDCFRCVIDAIYALGGPPYRRYGLRSSNTLRVTIRQLWL